MSDTSIKAWLAARGINVKHATQEQREEIRQELLRRTEERRNSPTGQFQRYFLLALFALGSAAAVASFFVKDHMGIDPKHAMAGLITVPYFLKVLLGREPGLLARVSFYVGGILLLSLWLQYWGW